MERVLFQRHLGALKMNFFFHIHLKMRETWLSVCFCKDPEFAANLDTILQFASRDTSLPLYIIGNTTWPI